MVKTRKAVSVIRYIHAISWPLNNDLGRHLFDGRGRTDHVLIERGTIYAYLYIENCLASHVHS